MMNVLARILSHGFAIAVVALLAIGLIYRGELFPDLQLPSFLVPDSGTVAAEQSGDGVPAEATVEAVPESGMEDASPETTSADVAAPAEAEPVTEKAVATVTDVEAISVETAAPVAAESVPPPLEEDSVTIEEATQSDVAVVPGATETVTPPDAEETAPGATEEDVVEAVPAVETDTPTAAALESSEAPVTDRPVMDPGTVEATAPVVEPVPQVRETEIAATESVDVARQPAMGSEPVESAPAAETVPAGESRDASADEAESEPEKSTDLASYQLLAAARESFWKNDYEAAEAGYRSLIDLDPANPDGYGELGNLYFSQGKWEEAATAFFEAGKRLVASGHNQQASGLVNVIRGLNGAQADELETLISDSTKSAVQP
jgi:TolA-binding protein